MARWLSGLKFVIVQQHIGMYVGIVCTLIALIIVALVPDPYAVTFYVWDPRIRRSYKHEKISPVLSWIVGAVALVLTALLFETVYLHDLLKNQATKWHRIAHFFFAAVLATIVSGLMQQAAAIAVGELRPDFMSRCNPTEDPALYDGPVKRLICQNPESTLVLDGSQALASGHAAAASLLAVYLGIYVFSTLYFRGRHIARRLPRWKSELLSTAALFWVFVNWGWAWAVASSRVADHRHDTAETAYGMLLGTVVGSLFALYALGIESTMPMFDPSTGRAVEDCHDSPHHAIVTPRHQAAGNEVLPKTTPHSTSSDTPAYIVV